MGQKTKSEFHFSKEGASKTRRKRKPAKVSKAPKVTVKTKVKVEPPKAE